MTTVSRQSGTLATCFAQVLTPVDFSPASWLPVSLAGRLAAQCGARHRVLHVDTASPWRGEAAGELRVEAAPGGRHVEVDVLAGCTPADGIIRVLGETAPSLLVMSTHGHTAVAESILGSTTEQVLHRWDGPIVALGPVYRDAPDLRRIVVGIEPSLPLPGQLLEDVRAWSAWLDLPVTVFGVTSDTLRPERVRDLEQLEKAAVAVSQPGRPAGVATFGSGSVPGNIVEFADAEPGTLIAVATHVRSLATRMVLGSVAMAVCRRSSSPVLLRRFDAHLCEEGCGDASH
jgi:nucleotide-binding universal stress UspA family protein